MNKRVKKLWVKALRSGEFVQGYNQLKRGRDKSASYCCLGVLCEVAKREGVIRAYRGGDGFPSAKVLEWAGLERSNPRMPRISATRFNDTLKKPFTYIADRIEKYL